MSDVRIVPRFSRKNKGGGNPPNRGGGIFFNPRRKLPGKGGGEMGIFGIRRPEGQPHPRKEPLFHGPLTAENVERAFGGSVDFQRRKIWLGGDREKAVEVCSVSGMVRTERANDYVLRPLAQNRELAALSCGEAFSYLAQGGIYNLSVSEVETLDDGVAQLIDGALLLIFPQLGRTLACAVATEEKRSISDPENEPAIKGAQDAFVESGRTNTSLVRRRLRSPMLRVEEEIVGRQSRTPVDLLYIEGIARTETVQAVRERLKEIDIDGLLAAGNLEQYMVGELDTTFPLIYSTQRPDRFCANLLAGRVGILADGIPLGFLLPGTLGVFFATEQDRTDNWVVAGCLTALRYAALLVTLFLPAVYVAAVLFHPEMIPLALAKSIISAEEGVPFGALFEVILLLLAFEIIQEAGLRLPGNLGQTVSILGGLVVGSAAVEAKIVSPAILIVVATAGIAGHTIPDQDFAGGVRLWRLVLAAAGGLGGFLAVTLVTAVLVGHLAGLTSFGVAYLTPFAARAGEQVQGHAVFRVPLPRVKHRPESLAGRNRRNQR